MALEDAICLGDALGSRSGDFEGAFELYRPHVFREPRRSNWAHACWAITSIMPMGPSRCCVIF
jgi:hypothetical protein